jgi:16S rRNA (cytosine967-C5)-methyltransferase
LAAGSADLAHLDARDRNFAFTLVLTSLRRHGEAKAVIAHFLDRPLPRKSGSAAIILHFATVQLLFLGIAPHAAIDLAVRAAKLDRNATHFANLINAVLRKIAATGARALEGLDIGRINTPQWLWQRWVRDHGEEIALRIGLAHRDEPPLDLTVKRDAEAWAERLGGIVLSTGSVRLQPGHAAVETLEGYAQGEWWVQDAAAAVPARLLGEISGQRVLDLCAAPGGKTLQLCEAGARVTALDISAARLERVRDNLKRTGLSAELVVGDALAFAPSQAYDAVLLDGPCSATGTIRRHPDLPFVKSDRQIGELAALQKRLLDKAAGFVKAGGRLIYCTCSLEPEEGEGQIPSFLARHDDFTLLPVKPGQAGLEPHFVSKEGYFRSLPFMPIGPATGLDGFFAARLLRR